MKTDFLRIRIFIIGNDDIFSLSEITWNTLHNFSTLSLTIENPCSFFFIRVLNPGKLEGAF